MRLRKGHLTLVPIGLLVTLACLTPFVARAQTLPDTGVVVMTSGALRGMLDSLRRTGQQSRALGDRETFHFLAIQRTVTGSVEIHADWTDVFLITDGHGQLRHSGRASNGRATAPGEYRGGTMQGGRSQSLGVGDVVVIPAGTAHQIVLAAGQRIGYLTFKLRAPRMPLPVRSTPP